MQLPSHLQPGVAAAAAGQLPADATHNQQQAAGHVQGWQQLQQQADQRQRQQQQGIGMEPVSHMCLGDNSKDVLVFLSDCDATNDSIRPL